MAENNLYCGYCGTKADGENINLNSVASQQKIPPQNSQISSQRTAGAVNSYANTESVPVSFAAKKILGQFLVSSVTIEIGSQQYKTAFNKNINFQVPVGFQNVTCYMNYLGKTGVAKAQYNFFPGRPYNITYSSPFIVTEAGKITIH